MSQRLELKATPREGTVNLARVERALASRGGAVQRRGIDFEVEALEGCALVVKPYLGRGEDGLDRTRARAMDVVLEAWDPIQAREAVLLAAGLARELGLSLADESGATVTEDALVARVESAFAGERRRLLRTIALGVAGVVAGVAIAWTSWALYDSAGWDDSLAGLGVRSKRTPLGLLVLGVVVAAAGAGIALGALLALVLSSQRRLRSAAALARRP